MKQLPIREKVAAYITQEDNLLVFTERGFTEIGQQIPSGTVESSENLEEAVLREVFEESGLRNLRVNKYLGTNDIDQRKYGQERIHRIHYFHLMCKESTPEAWSHEEKDPSERDENTPERIIFDFLWVKLPEGATGLKEGFDTFLSEVTNLVISPNHT
ncbi:MAG: NUDIX domain-containing protein [Candidatus Thorarchaeota archaeon]